MPGEAIEFRLPMSWDKSLRQRDCPQDDQTFQIWPVKSHMHSPCLFIHPGLRWSPRSFKIRVDIGFFGQLGGINESLEEVVGWFGAQYDITRKQEHGKLDGDLIWNRSKTSYPYSWKWFSLNDIFKWAEPPTRNFMMWNAICWHTKNLMKAVGLMDAFKEWLWSIATPKFSGVMVSSTVTRWSISSKCSDSSLLKKHGNGKWTTWRCVSNWQKEK